MNSKREGEKNGMKEEKEMGLDLYERREKSWAEKLREAEFGVLAS